MPYKKTKFVAKYASMDRDFTNESETSWNKGVILCLN